MEIYQSVKSKVEFIMIENACRKGRKIEKVNAMQFRFWEFVDKTVRRTLSDGQLVSKVLELLINPKFPGPTARSLISDRFDAFGSSAARYSALRI